MDLLEDLEYRGLLYQVTDRDGLARRLNAAPITLYNGFDPTAVKNEYGARLWSPAGEMVETKAIGRGTTLPISSL